MTPEEINSAIAKILGWESHIHGKPEFEAEEKLDAMVGAYAGMTVWKTPQGKFIRGEPPNYLIDLNAMHDAEKSLNQNQMQRMSEILFNAVEVPRFHATAAQHAEAFLRALDLYIPS